ncbi:MAG: HAD-IA family hydrolase, partial [Patescibacteria group bacterium]
ENMIKAILFDIGGILYVGKREDFYNKLQDFLGIKDNSFAELFEKNFDELLLGNKSFFSLVDELNVEVSKKEFETKARQAWLETFIVKKEMVELIENLKENYTVCCLSNASDLDVIMDTETGIDMLFDIYVNSCETHSKKPEQQIFEIALEKLNVKADECIFIDDREKYLLTPEKMKFKVLLFENVQKLKSELRLLDIKIEY